MKTASKQLYIRILDENGARLTREELDQLENRAWEAVRAATIQQALDAYNASTYYTTYDEDADPIRQGLRVIAEAAIGNQMLTVEVSIVD